MEDKEEELKEERKKEVQDQEEELKEERKKGGGG